MGGIRIQLIAPRDVFRLFRAALCTGVAGRAPAGLSFALGLRPGLPPLARYRSGDRAA